MESFLTGWAFTVSALGLITVVFLLGALSLARELRYVRALTDYLGADLAASRTGEPARAPDLLTQGIREEVQAVVASRELAWASKQVRGWQMRAQRLEPALAFWVDLLRQLGLLFTVVGLGFSFAVVEPSDLIKPLGLAVWTTVAGLAFSVLLSAQFGMKMPVWSDTCEKNIEAWDVQRTAKESE